MAVPRKTPAQQPQQTYQQPQPQVPNFFYDYETFDMLHPAQIKAREREQKDRVSRFKIILANLKLADISHIRFNVLELMSYQYFICSLASRYGITLNYYHDAAYKFESLKDHYEKLYSRALLLYQQRDKLETLTKEMVDERLQAGEPDPFVSDNMGWRGWNWDTQEKRLVSPAYRAIWDGPELRTDKWCFEDTLRGVAGIHARRVPRDWKAALWGGHDAPESTVTGLVERFGKFVLGELGWRAEWVIIRKLLAPTEEMGLLLEMTYPEVEVVYFDSIRYGKY